MAVNRSFSARPAPRANQTGLQEKGRIRAAVYGPQQLQEEEYWGPLAAGAHRLLL